MQYFPIFLRLTDKPCLVVGGGSIASRKIRRLLQANAKITVLAPVICDELKSMLATDRIQHICNTFSPYYINGYTLVIAATNNAETNAAVSTAAQQQHVPVNVVDEPQLCSFIMPAVVDRDPIQIAISSGGGAPILTRLLRAKVETMLPSSYGKLAALMKKYRHKVKSRYPSVVARRRFWEKILRGSIAELLYAGRTKTAFATLEKQLQTDTTEIDSRGEVYLVGGGPGDPELLTFRALRLMQQADIVLYDRLVAKEIVELVRSDAERIYVGKQRNQHTLSQHEINTLMVKLAKQGKRVLRLKGGDPFMFGRGGEEIESLSSHEINFQIVPGITAANACAAYAGIPLTHRDHAQSCLFVTGHIKDNQVNLNWESVVQPQQTLVIYMGIAGLEIISHQLIRHGLMKTTPAAIVARGSTSQQQVYIGDLQGLPDLATKHHIKAPGLIIVGDVVTLHSKLAWFRSEKQPPYSY